MALIPIPQGLREKLEGVYAQLDDYVDDLNAKATKIGIKRVKLPDMEKISQDLSWRGEAELVDAISTMIEVAFRAGKFVSNSRLRFKDLKIRRWS